MDYNDYPTTRSFSPKLVLFVFLGVVALAVLIWGVIRVVRSSSPSEFEAINRYSSAELKACDTSKNPDGCKDQLVRELAQQAPQEDVCVLLDKQEKRDDCYLGTMIRSRMIDACTFIQDTSTQESCEDQAWILMAIDQHDDALCEKVKNKDRVVSCQKTVRGPVTQENCEDRDPALCSDLAQLDRAIMTQDQSVCNQIVNAPLQDECRDRVDLPVEAPLVSVDTDADGLSDVDEEQYKTNPNNPDTDGDTYSDGQEVTGGYNPLGPGLLSP